MNCELEYQTWKLLDQLGSHPEIEERKNRIVQRTLDRIEFATRCQGGGFRSVLSLTALLHGTNPAASTDNSPVRGVKIG